MGTTLSTVGQRVAQTQERVAAARISTEEITGTLRDWAKREVGQRVAERLNAAEKSERLASIIEQADNWLEVAESSVGLVQDMLSINASSGAPSETTPIDQLLSEITSLRGQLAGATKIIADIHDRLAEANDAPPERIEQLAQIALPVVATLGSVDSRLNNLSDRLSAAQSRLQDLKTRSWRWILMVTVAVTLLIVLMAAGQVALCRLAWVGLP